MYLVKLVNADDTSVCKDHGSSLESSLPSLLIGGHRCCQTNARRATPSGGHRTRGSVQNIAKHLRLGRGRVSDQKNVDVTADTQWEDDTYYVMYEQPHTHTHTHTLPLWVGGFGSAHMHTHTYTHMDTHTLSVGFRSPGSFPRHPGAYTGQPS